MKRAYVIGNNNYDTFSPLSACINDAKQFKENLSIIGYDNIRLLNDCSYSDLKNLLDIIKEEVENGDEVIFYFSGHGMYYDGFNYLAGTDAKSFKEIKDIKRTIITDKTKDKIKCISTNDVLESLCNNVDGHNIFIIDACRTVEERTIWNKCYSNTKMSENKNYIMLFAAAEGNPATITGNKKNSDFTEALLATMFRINQDINEWYKSVCNYLKYNKSKLCPQIVINNERRFYLVNDQCEEKVWEKYSDELLKIYTQYNNDRTINNYFDDATYNKLIHSCEASIQSPLGFLNMLIDEPTVNIIDIYKDRCAIQFVYKHRIFINNINLYNFDKLCSTVIDSGYKDSIFTIYKFANITLKLVEQDKMNNRYIILEKCTIPAFSLYDDIESKLKKINSNININFKKIKTILNEIPNKNVFITCPACNETSVFLSEIISQLPSLSSVSIIEYDCPIQTTNNINVQKYNYKNVISNVSKIKNTYVVFDMKFYMEFKNYNILFDNAIHTYIATNLTAIGIANMVYDYNNTGVIDTILYPDIFENVDIIITFENIFSRNILYSIYVKNNNGKFIEQIHNKMFD